jgi:hypothetical protein
MVAIPRRARRCSRSGRAGQRTGVPAGRAARFEAQSVAAGGGPVAGGDVRARVRCARVHTGHELAGLRLPRVHMGTRTRESRIAASTHGDMNSQVSDCREYTWGYELAGLRLPRAHMGIRTRGSPIAVRAYGDMNSRVSDAYEFIWGHELAGHRLPRSRMGIRSCARWAERDGHGPCPRHCRGGTAKAIDPPGRRQGVSMARRIGFVRRRVDCRVAAHDRRPLHLLRPVADRDLR